jgi:hypothetical protein
MPNIDTLIAFENGELELDEAVEFIQDGIDRGWVWQLQGFYGRTARAMIEQGYCHA